jgi:hypothetical protein
VQWLRGEGASRDRHHSSRLRRRLWKVELVMGEASYHSQLPTFMFRVRVNMAMSLSILVLSNLI